MRAAKSNKSLTYSSVTLSLLTFLCFVLISATEIRSAEELENFIVEPVIPVAGVLTSYQLSFDLNINTYKRLKKGGFIFKLPEGFGLGNIESVVVTDDHPGRDPEVKKITVDGQLVKIELKVKLGDDDDDSRTAHKVRINIKITSVLNPDTPGEYQLLGWAFKKKDILAGPTLSQPFTIGLEEPLAVLEIISTEVIAPNSPKVNTGQSFQIRTLIANTGFSDASDVVVGLSSNGHSSFNPEQVIDVIHPGDTVAVTFDVVAATERNPSETFEVSVVEAGIEVSIIDNEATAVIQTPAILALSSLINNGDTVIVKPGRPFKALYQLSNLGEASVGNGGYLLSTGGVDFGIDSLQSGKIVVGEPVLFDLVAPSNADTFQIAFYITQRPIDSNDHNLAPLADTSVLFTVIVESHGKDPLGETYIIENNPFNPDDGPVEFKYELTQPAVVMFRIFTITGEEVYSARFLPGEKGGSAGENIIEWDGRNDKGDMVLNGVYVTSLSVAGTGQTATLKLAVIK